MPEKPNKSALNVMPGAASPGSINPRHKKGLPRKKRPSYSCQDYVDAIFKGDCVMLGQAITLIESTTHSHQQLAQDILNTVLPRTGKSLRIGITGVPGVGKSTFIESFGSMLIERGKKVAVLAVDPSSARSKGSILGDKVRMEKLGANPNAFIRPSPSAGSLGGVAHKTRETMLLCEAAGYEIILVETVGVGQSETAVHAMVDFFLLLMLSGAGDELQGIKRGIMEMADTIAITKADGDNHKKSLHAKQEYEHALHLFPKSRSGWTPKVLTCSSYTNEGIEDIWEIIAEHHQLMNEKGLFLTKRQNQAQTWLNDIINNELKSRFYAHGAIQSEYEACQKKVLAGALTPYRAAEQLLTMYFS